MKTFLFVLAAACLAEGKRSDLLTATPMLPVFQGNIIAASWVPVYSGSLVSRQSSCGSDQSCGNNYKRFILLIQAQAYAVPLAIHVVDKSIATVIFHAHHKEQSAVGLGFVA